MKLLMPVSLQSETQLIVLLSRHFVAAELVQSSTQVFPVAALSSRYVSVVTQADTHNPAT